jgi:hypothetical protein
MSPNILQGARTFSKIGWLDIIYSAISHRFIIYPAFNPKFNYVFSLNYFGRNNLFKKYLAMFYLKDKGFFI